MCTSTRTLSFLIFPSICLLVLTKLLPNPFINHSILSDIPSSLPSTFLYILSSFYVSSVFHPMFPNSLPFVRRSLFSCVLPSFLPTCFHFRFFLSILLFLSYSHSSLLLSFFHRLRHPIFFLVLLFLPELPISK